MSRQTLLCGHQPGFHHPGILAKRILQHERASSGDIKPVWILVDQDVGDPGAIRFPDLDAKGRLIERTWHVVPHRPGTPTGTISWTDEPTPPPEVSSDMPDSVKRGLEEIHEALSSAKGDTLAERFDEAQEQLLQTRLSSLVGPSPEGLRATTILNTDGGRAIVNSILEAPEDCALAWNEAARLVPRSARALRINRGDPGRTEVPCWTLDDAGRRIPATVDDLQRHLDGAGVVHPRAFLMTAVLRSSSAHPMIHGTGGERYELVTDRWAAEFLDLELPPISVCTADLRLPLDVPGAEPNEKDPREILRRLKHDPWSDETTKVDLAKAIRLAPRRSAERRRLFDAMQKRLDEERRRLAPRLDALQEDALLQGLQSRERRIAAERTWPWPLYEDRALLGMKLKTTSLEG